MGTLRVDAERAQGLQPRRHEPLAARLVDDPDALLDEGARQAGTPRVERGGQADGPTSDDDDVEHRPIMTAPLAAGPGAARPVPVAWCRRPLDAPSCGQHAAWP